MDYRHFRHAGDLLTPRKDITDRDPNLNQTPLVTSQRLRRIEVVYKSSEKTFDDKVEAADEIGHMVRQTLSFGSIAAGTPRLWGWDERTETVRTNCFGHTIISSELMDAIGVPHMISFVNAHSFITLLSEDSRHAHMVDPPTKDLFLDIDSAVHGRWPQAVFEHDEAARYATNTLDTRAVLGRVVRKSSERVKMENRWLDARQGKVVTPKYDENEVADALIMRTYRPKDGREVLENYGMAMQYTLVGQLDSALDRFRKLEGVYPDVEAGNKLALARLLRDRLFRLKRYEEAEDVVRVVDESLEKNGTLPDRTPNKYFVLDTLRSIAFAHHQPDILEALSEAYVDEFGHDSLTTGKAQRARHLARVAVDQCRNS